jgi:hypothetical protein
VQCDLDTLIFAQNQIKHLEKAMTALAAQDPRVVLLIQLPGIGLITAMTLLAAIGDISRFPSANHLVGYAGLGARVHDSGQTHRSGRITKAGRRDIRSAMVETAHSACRSHPHWQAEQDRLVPRLGKNKTTVAIARKILVTVWHVLTKGCTDKHAVATFTARKLLAHAYRLGAKHRQGLSPTQYVRKHLDLLGIGTDLTSVQWAKQHVRPLPPSTLTAVDIGT